MDNVPVGTLRCRSSFTTNAFTLLELLAVMAIIALLIAILLPSLSQARRQAKQAVCLSRLNAIATSARVYAAEDPNGWGIPVHAMQYAQNSTNPTYIGAYEWGGKSGRGTTGYVPGPGKDYAFLTSKYGTKAGFGPATRPMNDILFPGGFKDHLYPKYDRLGATEDTKLELDFFRCPADDGPPRGGHCPGWVATGDMSSYDYFGTSYAANLFLISLTPGHTPVWSNSPYLRPISRVPNTSRTIFFEENIGRWAWSSIRDNSDCVKLIPKIGIDPGPTKVIRGWHGKDWTYNRAFVDAHAETQTVWIAGTADPEGYAEHYRVELVFPDDPIRQQRNTCVIVRGAGWQKDTLPAEEIETGLISPLGGRVSDENCVTPAP